MRRNGFFGMLGLGAAMTLAIGGASGPNWTGGSDKAVLTSPRPARRVRKREILHAAGVRYQPVRSRGKPAHKAKHRNMLHVSKRTRRRHRRGRSK